MITTLRTRDVELKFERKDIDKGNKKDSSDVKSLIPKGRINKCENILNKSAQKLF